MPSDSFKNDFNSKKESLGEFYSISIEEFKISSNLLESYKIREPVTRNNFTSFLITSFAISEGSPKKLIMFLLWLKFKYNFDYGSTFINFKDCGGWDALSSEEQKMIFDAYNSNSKHKQINKGDFSVVHRAINSTLLRVVDTHRSEKKLSKRIIDDLKNVKDIEELKVYANNIQSSFRIPGIWM